MSKVIFISKYVLMKHIILKNNPNEWSLGHNTFPTPLEKGIECSSLAMRRE